MDTQGAVLKDVGVDHGGFDIFVAEEYLDGADVVSVLEQVGGVAMAKYMRGKVVFLGFCCCF